MTQIKEKYTSVSETGTIYERLIPWNPESFFIFLSHKCILFAYIITVANICSSQFAICFWQSIFQCYCDKIQMAFSIFHNFEFLKIWQPSWIWWPLTLKRIMNWGSPYFVNFFIENNLSSNQWLIHTMETVTFPKLSLENFKQDCIFTGAVDIYARLIILYKAIVFWSKECVLKI